MRHKALIRRLQISCLGLDAVDPLRLLVDDVVAALAQPKRTWVGLTEDERDHLAGLHLYAVRGQVEAWIEGVDDFAQAIEAKLKQKNHVAQETN